MSVNAPSFTGGGGDAARFAAGASWVAATSIVAGSSGVVNGTQQDNTVSRPSHSMVVIASGAPTAGTVVLQGSLDNVNWVTLATVSVTAAGTFLVNLGNCPMRFVRAAITVAITGGTVQAIIASA